jgi:hypothetical protein
VFAEVMAAAMARCFGLRRQVVPETPLPFVNAFLVEVWLAFASVERIAFYKA